MILPLRHARIEIVRWSAEADARAHATRHDPGALPFYIGEWTSEERVSSVVATKGDGGFQWSALMAEGERDPWIVPAFGGLLFVSRENLLLIDDHARVIARDQASYRFEDVLIGDTVLWIVGWHDALRVTGTGCEPFRSTYGFWDDWRLEGDSLRVWTEEFGSELLGPNRGGSDLPPEDRILT